jgi:hypothetical protein
MLPRPDDTSNALRSKPTDPVPSQGTSAPYNSPSWIPVPRVLGRSLAQYRPAI